MFEFANLGLLLFSGANTGYWACYARRLVLLFIDDSSCLAIGHRFTSCLILFCLRASFLYVSILRLYDNAVHGLAQYFHFSVTPPIRIL
jgi:hypothetical protein